MKPPRLFSRLSPGLRIVDANGAATKDFSLYDQRRCEAIESQLSALQSAVDAITAAQAAATAAQAAADTANTAAAAANDAAVAVTAQATLGDSYATGLTIGATDAGSNATISISAHNRVYPQPDGSNVTVAVNSGTFTGKAYSTSFWIYYDDPTRAGGAVTYQATTTQSTAAQTGARHFVGAVTTPAALGSPAIGKTIRAPGTVEP